MRDQIVTAFFSARREASAAFDRLLVLGVPVDEISILPKHVGRSDDIGLTAGTKASEGAALGAIAGGLVGALFTAAVAGGALIIPGLDAFLAGPAVAGLAGAGAGGAAGTALGALFGARLPEYEATYLDDAVGSGGSLLAVRCPAAAARTIEEALTSSGAVRIRSRRARSLF